MLSRTGENLALGEVLASRRDLQRLRTSNSWFSRRFTTDRMQGEQQSYVNFGVLQRGWTKPRLVVTRSPNTTPLVRLRWFVNYLR